MSAVPIKVARRRAALAKRGVAFASVLAFAATVGLARSSHPATASNSTSSATSSPSSQSALGTKSFGQASLGAVSSSQTPSVSTGAS